MTCKNVTKKRKAAPTVSIFNFNSVSVFPLTGDFFTGHFFEFASKWK